MWNFVSFALGTSTFGFIRWKLPLLFGFDPECGTQNKRSMWHSWHSPYSNTHPILIFLSRYAASALLTLLQFQNKRNRKRGGTRKVSSGDSEPAIPPSARLISGLPKRARQQTPAAPTDPLTTRPMRGLPKRALQPSPTPSTDSTATVDSVPLFGCFESPPTAMQGAAPVISFDGSSQFDPSFQPPLDFANFMSFDQAMGLEFSNKPRLDASSGMSMPGMGNWQEGFDALLQDAIEDPTLTTSPSFTSTTSSTSPTTVPDEATKEAIDNMPPDQLLAMLEEMLSKSSVSSMASSSVSQSGSVGDISADLESMDNPSNFITPLDVTMGSSSSESITPPSEYHQKINQTAPIVVDIGAYPQLNLYPVTLSPQTPIVYQPIMQNQIQYSVSPQQMEEKGWICDPLPFESVDLGYFGQPWMMDGQGYTHPRTLNLGTKGGMVM